MKKFVIVISLLTLSITTLFAQNHLTQNMWEFGFIVTILFMAAPFAVYHWMRTYNVIYDSLFFSKCYAAHFASFFTGAIGICLLSGADESIEALRILLIFASVYSAISFTVLFSTMLPRRKQNTTATS